LPDIAGHYFGQKTIDRMVELLNDTIPLLLQIVSIQILVNGNISISPFISYLPFISPLPLSLYHIYFPQDKQILLDSQHIANYQDIKKKSCFSAQSSTYNSYRKK